MGKKKVGIIPILFVLTAVVFTVLAVSRRPSDLFKPYRKTRFYDQAVQSASTAQPYLSGETYKQNSVYAKPVYFGGPECGSIDYTGSPEAQCDIILLDPYEDGLAFCWTHDRVVENFSPNIHHSQYHAPFRKPGLTTTVGFDQSMLQ